MARSRNTDDGDRIPILGVMPIFEFSLIVLFVVGAIYWFGFKRRNLISSGNTGESALAD